MAGDTSEGTRELDQTPTWAVAGVCAVIIVVSIALEKVLHKLGKFFTDKHKRALFEALEKVKAELMVLGFISLILTFSQYYIAKICIPVSVADTMLPCAKKDKGEKEKEGARRLLLWYEHGRILAGAKESSCKKGKVPIITVKGLHQLHILIFFLAVLHVVYSAATMALGRLKTRGWKQWEEETSSHDYEFSNDPSRFRLTHETSFVRAHTSFWTRIPFFFYIGCFFRQFFRSVSKSDYTTLRNGFINLHLAPGTKFNFQRSWSNVDIGHRIFVEDEHVRIDDLSTHLGSLPKPSAFYGTDSEAVMRLGWKEADNDHPLKSIMDDITKMMIEQKCVMLHARRDGNQCADHMARLGGTRSEECIVFEEPPMTLKPYLLRDIEAAYKFEKNNHQY
nr:MLO-like protein 8 [Tanacetum cinerariifolium]